MQNLEENEQLVNFRLILTSMQSPNLPVQILQNSLKIVSESPKGIKANLTNSFSKFDQSYFDSVDKIEWKPLMFSICLLHGVILERRKFGSIGWNIHYDFNQSDLITALDLLKTILTNFEELNWGALNYLLVEIDYGGRITNEVDRKVIDYLYNKFINKRVLAPNFVFGKSGCYVIPNLNSLGDINLYIQGLPQKDKPELFQMADDIDRVQEVQETDNLIELLDRIQSVNQSQLVVDQNKIRQLISNCIDGEIPIIQDQDSKEPSVKNLHNPLEIFLIQEI